MSVYVSAMLFHTATRIATEVSIFVHLIFPNLVVLLSVAFVASLASFSHYHLLRHVMQYLWLDILPGRLTS